MVISGCEDDRDPVLLRAIPFLSKLDSISLHEDGERKSVSRDPIISAISLLAFSNSWVILEWSICSSLVISTLPLTSCLLPKSVEARCRDVLTAVEEKCSQSAAP